MVRPLLKWAGGKRQLLPGLRRFYPSEFTRYFEPFLGSAAVFFDLCASGRLTGRPAYLTDTNADLIGCYTAVRDDPDAVIDALRRLEAGHHRDGSAHYYAVRERFNQQRAAAPNGSASPPYSPALAAMLLYLNRTGYNGLFRLNAKGRFNVPAGRYARPRVCDETNLRAVASVLRRNVSLEACGFTEAVAGAHAGDFLYFDPPYAALSPTSAFGAYTAARFSIQDQERLCAVIGDLARRGCAVLASNSSAASIERLYREAVGAGTGLALWRIPARRAINSRPEARGAIAELLLTNLTPRPVESGLVTVGPAPAAVRLAP